MAEGYETFFIFGETGMPFQIDFRHSSLVPFSKYVWSKSATSVIARVLCWQDELGVFFNAPPPSSHNVQPFFSLYC